MKKEDEVSIVISASEKKSAANILLFWLICWNICGPLLCFFLWKNPDKEVKIFIFVFAAFWLYYWVRVYYAFMWKRFGKEVIKIHDGKIFIKKDIRKSGKIHAYDHAFIKNLRRREINTSSIAAAISSADWLALKETLAFDFSGREVRFGYDLNEADAHELLRLVRYWLGRK